MPAKSMLTSQAKMDKAAKLRQKGAALERAAKIQRINAVLKRRPDLCDKVCETLANHGGSVEEEEKKATEGGGGCSGSLGRIGGSSFAGADEGDDGGTGEIDRIPRCETTLGSLRINRLEALLSSVELVAFSKHNLKALKPSGKKALTKEMLNPIIEFVSGWNPDFFLGTDGPLKSQRHLQSALGFANQERGRRGRELPLPPRWPRDGNYLVLSMETKIFIAHKFMKKNGRREVPASEVRKVHDAKALRIERNWSEATALLIEPRGYIRLEVMRLFPEVLEAGLDLPKAIEEVCLAMDDAGEEESLEVRKAVRSVGKAPPASDGRIAALGSASPSFATKGASGLEAHRL